MCWQRRWWIGRGCNEKIIPRFVSWPHQLFFLRRFRLEYGNQKVIICHISKDERMFFYKTYKDIFELSQIEKYGFSKDIYGKNLAEHKCVSIHKYAFMESYFQPALREIVFVLKDGRTVVFEGAKFTHGQLCGLVSYIEEKIGIRPMGRLSASLLVASFTEEKINFALDMIQFPEKELQNAQLRVDDTYFMKEAIVICKSGQMVYFPYDKLQAVLFYAKTRN